MNVIKLYVLLSMFIALTVLYFNQPDIVLLKKNNIS